jgi:hypothetical protein
VLSLKKLIKMKKLFIAAAFVTTIISCTEKKEGGSTSTPAVKKDVVAINNPTVTNWMSWEGGIDVAGVTDKNFKNPNVIIHIARMVNTPIGSAPSGLVLYQPDSTKPPVAMGFVSTNKTVGAYFGPKIFAGTPFEKAPVLDATIDVKYDDKTATTKIVTGGHTFEVMASELGAATLINRAAGSPMPFYQQGVEQKINKVIVKVDGKEVTLMVPPVGISGGPGAVVSPNGVYAR